MRLIKDGLKKECLIERVLIDPSQCMLLGLSKVCLDRKPNCVIWPVLAVGQLEYAYTGCVCVCVCVCVHVCVLMIWCIGK